MEQLEKAMLRDERRLSQNILKPVEIRSISDIKRVLTELDPTRNQPHSEIPISTMVNEVEGGKNVTYNVSSTTKSKSKRDILLEGISLIKNRMEKSQDIIDRTEDLEINGRKVRPAVLRSNTDGHAWVDPLIKQWTGGRRDGTIITWDLDDGYQYRYEIFAHKFTRVCRS
jgi:hypothetical protein